MFRTKKMRWKGIFAIMSIAMVLLGFLPTTQANASGYATPDVELFQHANGNGWAIEINENSEVADLRTRGARYNNEISSVRLQPGASVTLYQNTNFGGRSLTLTNTTNAAQLHNLTASVNNFNDITSSFRVDVPTAHMNRPTQRPIWVYSNNGGHTEISVNGRNWFRESGEHRIAGQHLHVRAVPNAAHRFSHWATSASTHVQNRNQAQTTAWWSGQATNARNVTAYFVRLPYSYINPQSQPASGGRTTVSYRRVTVGTSITMTATPNANYRFVRWEVTGAGSVDNRYHRQTTLEVRGTNVGVRAIFERAHALPSTVAGVQLRYNTWYTVRSDNFPNRGGLYSRGNNWAAQSLNGNHNGERIRFVNPNNRNSTAAINWGNPVRIEREGGGFLGRHWQLGTNWFVFNRDFNRGSHFNVRRYHGSIAISYTEAWPNSTDFINFNANGYLYLRGNVAHTLNFQESINNQPAARPQTRQGNQLRYNTWYYMTNGSLPNQGGIYSRGSWAAMHGSNNRGERIRFVNPSNQNSTALINWNAPVRIQRESGGFLGRHHQGSTNWFVFNRNFNQGSHFNVRMHNNRIGISYTAAWQDFDFISMNPNSRYLYLRHNASPAWEFSTTPFGN